MTAPRRLATEAFDAPGSAGAPRRILDLPALEEPTLAADRRPFVRSGRARRSLVAFSLATMLGLAALGPGQHSVAAAPADPATVAAIAQDVVLSREISAVTRGQERPTLPVTASATPTPTRAATPAAAAKTSSTPKPKPTATAKPTRTATPRVTAPKATARPSATPAPLAATAGSRWASVALSVRVSPSQDADLRGVLQAGDKVTVTTAVDGIWRQVRFDGGPGWVKAKYLVSTDPAGTATSTSGATTAQPSAAASSIPAAGGGYPACAVSSGIESGLTANTRNVYRAVCATFSGVSSYGGYRAGDGGYHGSGQAVDIMVSGDYGWQIAKWLRANASSLGVIEVIYSQQIWTAQRGGEGWRPMSDRGSVTANHYDHVHVSVG